MNIIVSSILLFGAVIGILVDYQRIKEPTLQALVFLGIVVINFLIAIVTGISESIKRGAVKREAQRAIEEAAKKEAIANWNKEAENVVYTVLKELWNYRDANGIAREHNPAPFKHNNWVPMVGDTYKLWKDSRGVLYAVPLTPKKE